MAYEKILASNENTRNKYEIRFYIEIQSVVHECFSEFEIKTAALRVDD